MTSHRAFVTGATGYMGRRLISELTRERIEMVALARPGSETKVPPECQVTLGNALDADSYADHIGTSDTFVHLVGVSHPSPAKAREFRDIDLKSAEEAVKAAKSSAKIRHFVYVSVAHPAPMMKAYIEARAEAEMLIRESQIPATILRPWYVVGLWDPAVAGRSR